MLVMADTRPLYDLVWYSISMAERLGNRACKAARVIRW
jgi:hypothetical protein